MSEEKELDIITEAEELDDNELEDVSGGGCSNGGGCVDGDCGEMSQL